MKDLLKIIIFLKSFFRYNLKVIYLNRFIWFFVASFAFYIFIIFIKIKSKNFIDEAFIYNALLFPGILFLFFPSVFGIQIDKDTGILEILFGIPDYRYKVWLTRLFMVFFITFIFILFLTSISSLGITRIHIFEMCAQIIMPLIFFSAFSFLISTIVKSGFGTAVIIIILGIVFFILSESLKNSMWNIFLNPFKTPDQLNEFIWQGIIIKNRIFLSVSTVLFLLFALFNLQNRESFMK